MQVLKHSGSQVIIAVDPQQSVVDRSSGRRFAAIVSHHPVPISEDVYRELHRFTQYGRTPAAQKEGATGLGAPLTHRLSDDGVNVVDIPAKLAVRVRLLSTGHGRKSDNADADAATVGATRESSASSAIGPSPSHEAAFIGGSKIFVAQVSIRTCQLLLKSDL